jgi:osmotically-inducible protein OsmY
MTLPDTRDLELARIVREDLAFDGRVDGAHVLVSVLRGRATLSGWVATTQERSSAGTVAAGVAGVRSVDNQLSINRAAGRLVDTDLVASVTAALAANPLVPKSSIRVSADGGWVTLSGHVGHHFQHHAAQRVVRRAPGVQGVTDEVEVGRQTG